MMEPVNDVSVGNWIRPRLSTGWGSLTAVVPSGFDAYVRVLHPVDVDGDHVVRWRDVAAVTGRRVHPLVQWWRLINATGSVNPRSELWDGGEPDIGSLDPPDNQRLVDLLAGHTNSPNNAYFAVWEGNGFFHPGATAIYGAGRSQFRSAPVVSLAWELIAGPRLRHPGRDYVLLSGPLRDASTIPDLLGAKPWTPSANLVWPQDQSWCIATEVDFDSTLVGCSRAAAHEILECSDLESFPVSPNDSLQYDADVVNT